MDCGPEAIENPTQQRILVDVGQPSLRVLTDNVHELDQILEHVGLVNLIAQAGHLHVIIAVDHLIDLGMTHTGQHHLIDTEHCTNSGVICRVNVLHDQLRRHFDNGLNRLLFNVRGEAPEKAVLVLLDGLSFCGSLSTTPARQALLKFRNQTTFLVGAVQNSGHTRSSGTHILELHRPNAHVRVTDNLVPAQHLAGGDAVAEVFRVFVQVRRKLEKRVQAEKQRVHAEVDNLVQGTINIAHHFDEASAFSTEGQAQRGVSAVGRRAKPRLVSAIFEHPSVICNDDMGVFLNDFTLDDQWAIELGQLNDAGVFGRARRTTGHFTKTQVNLALVLGNEHRPDLFDQLRIKSTFLGHLEKLPFRDFDFLDCAGPLVEFAARKPIEEVRVNRVDGEVAFEHLFLDDLFLELRHHDRGKTTDRSAHRAVQAARRHQGFLRKLSRVLDVLLDRQFLAALTDLFGRKNRLLLLFEWSCGHLTTHCRLLKFGR